MTWFEALPLDFTRPEPKEMERLLLAAYPNEDELRRLAEDAGLDLLVLPRVPPRDLGRELLKRARLSNRLLPLVIQVLTDPSREAVHDRLKRLFAGREAVLAAAALDQRSSLATLAAMPPSLEVWGASQASAQPLAAPGLEKIVNAAAGFTDIAVFREKIAEAEARTARIEIGGKPKGTGFLIADSLLLTNWHVVKNGVEGALARFDHKVLPGGTVVNQGRAVAFAADWLLAHSPHDAIPVEIGSPGPEPGKWDYALVRLAEPAGAQGLGANPEAPGSQPRGCYPLEGTAYHFDAQEPILIVGHPDGRPAQLSYASPSGVALTQHRSRIRYGTNTEGGSSGSPVFNRDFRVVALHHAAGPTAVPGEFNFTTKNFNQGIPIAHIVADLRQKLAGKPAFAELGWN